MLLDLTGRTVLITGAARGLGRAMASEAHRRGARVVLTDLVLGDVAAVARALDGPGGGPQPSRTLALAADVTRRETLDAAVAAAVERFGGLDVVVANAGVAVEPVTTVAGVPDGDAERVLDVDLLGVWHTVRAALPEVTRTQGHVLLVASVYAFLNGMANAPYAMAKAGVEQLGRALRVELAGHGASAGVLYPGWARTAISAGALGEDPVAASLVRHVLRGPFGRSISPGRVATAALDGVERRAARTVVPRRWAPLSVLRGPLAVLGDAALDRDETTHAFLARLEERSAAAAPAVPPDALPRDVVPPDALPQHPVQPEVGASLVASIPLASRAGLQVLVAERGRARCRMPLEGNGNHVGTMYAGAVFTLAEVPGGVVALASFDPVRYVPIVKSVQIRFRRPATTDVEVEVRLPEEEIVRLTAAAEADGKVDFPLDAELVDTEGTVVAISSGLYQLRALPRP